MLGGDIHVESIPNHGSVFRFQITTTAANQEPLVTATGLQDESREARDGSSNPTRLAGMRLLLAEDNPDLQALIAAMLRKQGAEVDLADNGQLAVESAWEAAEANKPYQVVLMDMQMPIMDGVDATRTLRARGYRGPIVALTAAAYQADREKLIEAGCDDVETKPVQRGRLLVAIERWGEGVSDKSEAAGRETAAGRH